LIKLSAVIITLNEERNIERCLTSLLNLADEIIVLDSFSSDKTKEICTKFNVRFIQKQWKGYSNTKNYANSLATNNFILSIDADEEISETLKNSIASIKEENLSIVYSFNRLTNYCGKWINHCGWYPDKKVRIFSKENTTWKGEIHEELEFAKPVFELHLTGNCNHYSYYSIAEHYLQAEKYSTLLAIELSKKKENIFLYKLLLSPMLRFVRDYFFRLGLLDGYYGFVICKISAYATYLKYKKARTLNRKNNV
jgi:glycosyltransferase involved in cell wall biosynthesis